MSKPIIDLQAHLNPPGARPSGWQVIITRKDAPNPEALNSEIDQSFDKLKAKVKEALGCHKL